MHVYLQLGDLAGTADARHLAAQLAAWHDAMVRHIRMTGSRKAERCTDDCPHDEAAILWSAALSLFGERAHALGFLRRYGSAGPPLPGSDGGMREARV
jgi:hypothetical protein